MIWKASNVRIITTKQYFQIKITHILIFSNNFFIYFTGKKQFGIEELGRNIEKPLQFAQQITYLPHKKRVSNEGKIQMTKLGNSYLVKLIEVTTEMKIPS